MHRAEFRFYAELNDLLPPARRGRAFECRFEGRPAVKDVVEALGVPHTEVDLLLADGEPVDLGWRLRDGARVAVYPVFESIDVSGVTRVRAPPLRDLRFLLDVHLGRLARHLRMVGLDAAWSRDAADAALAQAAAAEGRVLLTRDRGLLKRSAVERGYWVRALDPARQLGEVVRRFDLAGALRPLTRCLRCNAPLEEVAAEAVAAEVPPRVRERQRAYRRCPMCRRVYWAGTHVERMRRLIDEAVAAAGRPGAP